MSVVAGPIIKAEFSGNNGLGAIAVPGLKVGDFLVWAMMSGNASLLPMGGGELEPMVSVADEIQQVDAADLSGHTFTVLIIRAA
jgi:hypothetical protein